MGNKINIKKKIGSETAEKIQDNTQLKKIWNRSKFNPKNWSNYTKACLTISALALGMGGLAVGLIFLKKSANKKIGDNAYFLH